MIEANTLTDADRLERKCQSCGGYFALEGSGCALFEAIYICELCTLKLPTAELLEMCLGGKKIKTLLVGGYMDGDTVEYSNLPHRIELWLETDAHMQRRMKHKCDCSHCDSQIYDLDNSGQEPIYRAAPPYHP